MHPGVTIALNIGKCIVCAGAALVAGSIARRYAFEAAGEIIVVAGKMYAGEMFAEAAATASMGGGEGAAAAV